MYVCFVIKSSSSGSNNNSSPRCYSDGQCGVCSCSICVKGTKYLAITPHHHNPELFSSPHAFTLHLLMAVMLTLARAMHKRCQMIRASSYSHISPDTMSMNCKSLLLWWPGPWSSKLHQLCPLQLSPAGQGQAGGWRRTLGIIFTFWMHLHLFCRQRGDSQHQHSDISTRWKY